MCERVCVFVCAYADSSSCVHVSVYVLAHMWVLNSCLCICACMWVDGRSVCVCLCFSWREVREKHRQKNEKIDLESETGMEEKTERSAQ